MFRIMLLLTAFTLLLAPDTTRADDDFNAWLAGLRNEARSQGISDTTLDAALTGLEPIPRVIELDRYQPEFTQTFWKYLDIRVSETRIVRGRQLLVEHAALLNDIEARYGVQPRFLVAFWGLETNFGDNLGGFPVIGALATLAHDTRRSDFFRRELLAALTIIEQGNITVPDMQGSWAGAMGQPQFMPSTFVRFAVDADNDGRRDIWHSLPDVFASAANFLSKSGWQGDKTWGREIRLPANFDPELAGLETTKKLAEWQAIGVRRPGGGSLPRVDQEASVILPAGIKGPAFLAYRNYRTIMVWNRSHLYALAVGHLADRLTGDSPLQSPRPANETPLSRGQIIEIQQQLAADGFDPGPADGIIGSQTRAAIKQFQRTAGLPSDGYPSPELLEKLNAFR